MKKTILAAGLALTLTTLHATPFFTLPFEERIKNINDEIAMFLNNDSFIKAYPKMDLFENKKEYRFQFELPGVEKKNIKVTLTDQNILTISGEKKSFTKEEKNDILRQENFHGSFSRSLSMPDDINKEKIKVTYTDGILTVTIQKDSTKTKEKTKILPIE